MLSASVNLATERASVRVLKGPATIENLRHAITSAGYEPAEVAGASERDSRADESRALTRRLIAAAVLTAPVAVSYTHLRRRVRAAPRRPHPRNSAAASSIAA